MNELVDKLREAAKNAAGYEVAHPYTVMPTSPLLDEAASAIEFLRGSLVASEADLKKLERDSMVEKIFHESSKKLIDDFMTGKRKPRPDNEKISIQEGSDATDILRTTVDPNTFSFFSDGEEMIKLTESGFHYKGEFVEDAGEAHALFVRFMRGAVIPTGSIVLDIQLAKNLLAKCDEKHIYCESLRYAIELADRN